MSKAHVENQRNNKETAAAAMPKSFCDFNRFMRQGESIEEFQVHRAQFHGRFKPQSFADQNLVDNLAYYAWRIRKACDQLDAVVKQEMERQLGSNTTRESVQEELRYRMAAQALHAKGGLFKSLTSEETHYRLCYRHTLEALRSFQDFWGVGGFGSGKKPKSRAKLMKFCPPVSPASRAARGKKAA